MVGDVTSISGAEPSAAVHEKAPTGVTTGKPSRVQFRPDIEGMRALAVGLVMLCHAYGQPFSGGFVGVDVFFVVSGFLITSLLLRERDRTGANSLAGFYARRVRRILPAATLVVLVTLFAAYHWLGFIAGNDVATDAKWTAVFAANLHFGAVGTDYFGAQSDLSPLQHMWSLGVEEQFYLVWPVMFLALLGLARGRRHRTVLAVALAGIIVASLSWSVFQTETNQTWAYFSPLTRGWALALGALVAVVAPALLRLRHAWLPNVLAVAGLSGIVLAALVYSSETRYPGYAVALPVVASALLIAAGCMNGQTIVARVLSLPPMQWIGARSYSMYLWHWPLLIIPARYATDDLTVLEVTGWVALSVVASALTYRFVENPLRRSRVLVPRTGWSLAVGLCLVAGTIMVAQWQLASHYGSWDLFG